MRGRYSALCVHVFAVIILLAMCASIALAVETVPIILEGQALPDKAMLVDGMPYVPLSMLKSLQGKTVEYDKTSNRIIVGGGNAKTKPVLEVAMGEPQYRDLVEGLGLHYRSTVSLPEKLQFYSCVILNNDNAVSTRIADRLKGFTESGGGVVLVGRTPQLLCGNRHVILGQDLSGVADWLGCPVMYSVTQSVLGGRNWSGVPATVEAAMGRPFGSAIAKGTRLLRYQGSSELPMLGSPDEFCQITAQWLSDAEGDDTYVAALLHPYGKGRVYWQFVSYDPNYPKLLELFRAGVHKAATGEDLKGETSQAGDQSTPGGRKSSKLKDLLKSVTRGANGSDSSEN